VRFAVEPMQMGHIPAVSAIEHESFSQPWPQHAYRKEIQSNRMAHYYVVKRLDAPALSLAELALDSPTEPPAPGFVQRFTRMFRAPPLPVVPDMQSELRTIVGYAGLWLMADEAHITTIAVHPKYRGMGLGELLLLQMVDTAGEIGARWLTLEVRKSNLTAQRLYHKYTFKEMGVRKRYYSDDGEDALVMWTDPIDSEAFLRTVARHRSALEGKLACDV
jgi:ribosomal-protein-alanine N-acetyltransferase